ncbi:MAG: polysaccharide biosynthesis tyrosine autokinase [Pseudomonadota bacterium]
MVSPVTTEDQGSSPPNGVELRTLIAVIWRGKWTAMAAAAVAAGLAALFSSMIPPSFDAEAQILLDTRDRRLAPFEQVVGDLAVDNAVVASEIAVLRSRRLLAAVVDRLSLNKDPEFAETSPGLVARLHDHALSLLPVLSEWLPSPPNQDASDPRATAIARLSAALTTAQKGRSYVIAVKARSTDPDKAALIANTVADTYVADQLDAKARETRRAADWLAARISDLKTQTADADNAVENFRASQSVGEGQGSAVTDQQLAEINTQLVTASAERAAAEARYEQIQRLINQKGESAAADVLSSPLILTLRQQRSEVRRREAELATRYGSKHPKMINVRAELRDIAGGIAAEIRKRVSSLANDAEVARTREATLVAALADVEDRSSDLSRASVGLRQLEREAAASRKIYEDVLARYKETVESGEIQQADARVISAAAAPSQPAAPKKGLIGGLATLTGLMLGFGLVFLGELTANTFRTAGEAEQALGLTVLAKIPRFRPARRRSRLLETLGSQPNSALAEGVRSLRNAMLLSRVDAPPRVVMVTSAAPGEGKSSACLALAFLSAQMGRRAVVVECDIRRPSLGQAIGGVDDAADLFDVLSGEADLTEALRPLSGDRAAALVVNKRAPQAADILSSQRFRDLVSDLSSRFDLVLLDTPPALAVADAIAVSDAAEATLLLARWDHTPRQAVTECVKRLREAGAPPVGLVLTMVDPKREAAYEYGGYRRGAPNYASYYA